MYEQCWENWKLDKLQLQKEITAKFSVLYNTNSGYKLKGEVCIWSAVVA